MGASGEGERTIAADDQTRRQLVTVATFDRAPKPPTSLDPHTTIVAAVELSKKTWLVAGHVPGLERRPLTRTDDHANGLLRILTAWRKRGEQAGRTIARIVVAHLEDQWSLHGKKYGFCNGAVDVKSLLQHITPQGSGFCSWST